MLKQLSDAFETNRPLSQICFIHENTSRLLVFDSNRSETWESETLNLYQTRIICTVDMMYYYES